MRVATKRPKPVSKLAGQIGKRIFDRRVELRISQQKVREAAGLSAAFFCDVENGKTRIGAENLCKIAQALGVDMNYFFEER